MEDILICRDCKEKAKKEGYKLFKYWRKRHSLSFEFCHYCGKDLWDIFTLNYYKEV